jgi:hypothetical protein
MRGNAPWVVATDGADVLIAEDLGLKKEGQPDTRQVMEKMD